MYCQVREIGQRSCRQEIVHKRERRLKAARQRRVVGRADEGGEPYEPMTASLKPRDLAAQLPWVPAIPTVGYEQDHRSPIQDPAAPPLMELLHGTANSRPPGPVGHRPRYRREGLVRSRHAQLSGDSRELSGEEERFDRAVAPRHGVSEVQEHTGVTLHGSADVA